MHSLLTHLMGHGLTMGLSNPTLNPHGGSWGMDQRGQERL